MPKTEHRFDVYGRRLLVVREGRGWACFYPGQGVRRRAHDVVLPAHTGDDELEQALVDACHEWATPEHPEVKRLG